MSAQKIISGPRVANLTNAISGVLHRTISAGMPVDDACCVAAGVVADYARAQYGDGYLNDLSMVLLARTGQPLPRGV